MKSQKLRLKKAAAIIGCTTDELAAAGERVKRDAAMSAHALAMYPKLKAALNESRHQIPRSVLNEKLHEEIYTLLAECDAGEPK